MSRTAKFLAIALASVLFLVIIVSCNNRSAVVAGYAQPAVVAQPGYAQAPVVVQQSPVVVAPSHDGFFTGMMMGHLMSGGSSHTTTIVHQAAPVPAAPAYRAPVVPSYRPVAPTYTPRPSYTTNSRGVSTSVSRSGGISVSSGRRR